MITFADYLRCVAPKVVTQDAQLSIFDEKPQKPLRFS
jgi:hypothetical protein